MSKTITIAFDWGGVIGNSRNCRLLCREMIDAGFDVINITARSGPRTRRRRKRIERQTKRKLQRDIPVHIVWEHYDYNSQKEAGQAKLHVMRQLGCTILIDDNPVICAEVRRGGLTAFCNRKS